MTDLKSFRRFVPDGKVDFAADFVRPRNSNSGVVSSNPLNIDFLQ